MEHLSVVLWLIYHQANVNARDSQEGWTALMLAAREGHIDVVLALIRYHAHVDEVTEFGWTALKLAAQGGHLVVTQSLIHHQR